MTTKTTPTPEYVHKAHAKKLKAEAKAAAAAARKDALEAAQLEQSLTVAQIQVEDVLRAARYNAEADERHHIYRFLGEVSSASTGKCMDTLNRWSRMEPGCDIEIIFFSPGGSVVDGMALFDTIQLLRKNGHKITTTCIGYAASMGGILLQAGDVRRMTPESWVLIHEVSASAMGSMGEITDRVEWLKRIQDRILRIFADRSKGSKAKKEDKLTLEQFREGWNRKDWWLSSDECLKHGIVDEVL